MFLEKPLIGHGLKSFRFLCSNTKYFDELNQIFEDQDNIYVHNWQPNELVIWNNLTVPHKRDHTPSHVKRRLVRYAFSR